VLPTLVMVMIFDYPYLIHMAAHLLVSRCFLAFHLLLPSFLLLLSFIFLSMGRLSK
jgi:hypothetical protein